MAIGIAALLVMMRIAIRAQRFDAVLVCAGAIGLMILGGTGLAWMLGLTRIPRVTSDGLTWIRVVRRNEMDITATESNVIELKEEERRARIATTKGDFIIDTDCAGL
ncbi:MAG TPA: hypothetical protein VGQ76_22650 [Thermoanaerobaculia bacterium]|jgi:hypothetical protein|nr:hypothetical protein [Thermoanaerobaculia bacterium]